MIINRTTKQCGKADYGWLQARYTFSFGHYFDPKFLGYGALRVLNQEVIAPKAAFQPKSYPHVDILNIILQGEVEYRDSEGNHVRAYKGECLLFSARQGISYSEHNISANKPLTRLQLWLNAFPQQESLPLQRMALPEQPLTMLASPTAEDGSMQLRQQVWVNHISLNKNQAHHLQLKGKNAYLQSLNGNIKITGNSKDNALIKCGDGAFIHEENRLVLKADTEFQGLLIDLAA
ncbi:pirin family protein [Photorhabdus sp. SF281]|uniref:pirin family protein n=1 Tax=Photorhabdus sp. SF281 TaxID=3459527 RepID=UPI0040446E4E